MFCNMIIIVSPQKTVKIFLFMMMGLGVKIVFNLLCQMGLKKVSCLIQIYLQRIVLVVALRMKHECEGIIDIYQLFIDPLPLCQVLC